MSTTSTPPRPTASRSFGWRPGWPSTGTVFLATKTGERSATAPGPASSARYTSRRGQLDLIQLHNLVEEDEWEVAHGPGGAVEALVRARDEGLVRFIGVTGHGLRIAGMHLRSLERFDFDSVLLPYNFALCPTAGTGPTSKRCSTSAGDAGSPFKPSSRWRGGVGGEERGRSSAGMSPWPTAPLWPGPCATCWAARACSSTARATPACSGPPWRPPSPAGRRRPRTRCPPTSSARDRAAVRRSGAGADLGARARQRRARQPVTFPQVNLQAGA